MIKVKKIPKDCILACSGGVDSMVLFHYLINGRKQFSVYHFDHGTPFATSAKNLVKEICEKHKVLFECFSFGGQVATEYTWRNWRNEIMQQAGNIYRPFIDASKKSITDYASRNGINFIEDPSNVDTSYKRNKVRHELLPLMRQIGINPLSLMGKSHE